MLRGIGGVCLSVVAFSTGCVAAEAPAVGEDQGTGGSGGAHPGGGGPGATLGQPATGGMAESDITVDPNAGSPGVPSGGELDLTMPPDFTPAELGGYKLGDLIPPDASGGTDTNSDRTDPCGAVLTGVVRDFATRQNTDIGHPDFGAGVSGLTRGLVDEVLDSERKPMASSTIGSAFIESAMSFSQWYRDVPPYNMPYYLMLYLQPDEEKRVFRFQSHDFYPLDGAGFGYEYLEHNYHFTFELHTAFVYQGAEVFEFTGDDDLWVFINGKLAIDLGGVHGEENSKVELDEVAAELGLAVGGTYALDFFQAERWCCGSNFAIETTLTFTDCGSVPVVR